MQTFSNYLLPGVLALVVIHGLIQGVKVFDCFLEGAKAGLQSAMRLLPALLALVVAVSMLRASGVLDAFIRIAAPAADFLGLPKEVMPLTVLSPLSGSGSLSMYESILNSYGADSYIGLVASVMMGSTETTFYAVTVYYGSIGIEKSRCTIPAALCADITGFVCSALTVRLFM